MGKIAQSDIQLVTRNGKGMELSIEVKSEKYPKFRKVILITII